MANKISTVFQNLDKVITGNWNDFNSQKHSNNYDLSDPNKILYKTDNKEDYLTKKLELQQDSWLNDRWIKANTDLSVQAFAGLNNVKLMYRDADLMDAFPEIGAALDIASEESVLTDEHGQVITVSSKSDRIKAILEDLFVNRLDIQVMANMIIRGLCKYGNQFMLLNIDSKNGITGWRQLPVFNVERLENGIANPYGGLSYTIPQNNLKSEDTATKFVWTNETSEQIPFRNWQIAHFRLINNSIYLPYGCLVGDTRIETENGYKEISNIEIGDKVWTFNIDKQKRELANVTMRMNKGEKDVFKVSTNHNFIEGTSDHKLLCYENDKLTYKEIGDIKIGDLLVIDNTNSKSNKIIEIDKVKNLEYVGKKETFDITVSNDNSNFFANGIVTHNCSYLNAARRHWRILSLMEDMMLIYRLERSIERRVYKIYVGAIDDADVQGYVQEIANNFKRTPIIDPMTGQVDLRKNIMAVDQDIFIPVRDPSAPTPIDTLSAAQNLTAIDDIKFIQNKVLTALRIPKSFLNFEEAAGNGQNLALMDVRFTRTINRIQQAFLMEMNKIASIHLYLLGFEDDLTNFTLSMTNPSTQAEQLEIDNVTKKISAIQTAVADPGTGIPIMSLTRALKQIMKWSDKEIQDNFEEIRLEKALATELQMTNAIIKRTGIFDNVDRIYGEPNAQYPEQPQGQDQGGGGMGGPGGGAPPPMPSGGGDDFGSALDSIGAPGSESGGDSIQGNSGEMPIGDAAAGGAEGAAPQPLQENKLLTELLNKSSHIKKEQAATKRVKSYNDAFMINEEFDSMINSIDKFLGE